MNRTVCLPLLLVVVTAFASDLGSEKPSSAGIHGILPFDLSVKKPVYDGPFKDSSGVGLSHSFEKSSRRRSKTRRELKKLRCHNGGVFKDGKCECVYPFTGANCLDYACVNGLSTGPRYDPHSLFFNKKCICNNDWDGELCDEPIADQCNDRGHYEHGRCACHGFYFGSECQYVSRCDFGTLKHGRCICNKGWEGDYCDRIVCQNGYAETKNGSQYCECPIKYKGLHCGQCLQKGPKIKPYPACTVDIIPASARNTREHTNTQIYARIVIISVAGLFLMGLVMLMYMLRWKRERYGRENKERPERQEMISQDDGIDVDEGFINEKKECAVDAV
ncbi:hypothetical protein L596_003846 [Steinernema carpocapsae]|uniref:EGF-like domain-containing protein n=1 Tax=Steinernema carpocapsae TaxID=34508 RepID=A0A4U8UX77_STECR|nr:hypothetical protein L596_003846 [Steinernema carpocapsae]